MARRSAAELIEFSDQRLLPDIQTFFAAGRTLSLSRLGLRPAMPWLLETATLESFALHARALIDFFFKRRRQTKWRHDALAIDFFDTGKWEALRPDRGPWIELVRGQKGDRFGAEMAHLRFDDAETLAAQARGWPITQVAGAVGGVLRIFVETVPEERVVPNFVEDAWREIPVFARVGVSGATPPLWTQAHNTRMVTRRRNLTGRSTYGHAAK